MYRGPKGVSTRKTPLVNFSIHMAEPARFTSCICASLDAAAIQGPALLHRFRCIASFFYQLGDDRRELALTATQSTVPHAAAKNGNSSIAPYPAISVNTSRRLTIAATPKRP